MEISRYNRQIVLPEVGTSGQEKLQKAKVLIIGAGGLGVAILPYLAGAGIGEIGIIDHDTIHISNLQRQVIYKNNSVGKSKVAEAKSILKTLNPTIMVNAINKKLDANNAINFFKNYDIIVDATDNLDTKYLINDASFITNKPFIYGSVYRFEGHVSVFNYQNGPTYRCLFPEDQNKVSNCDDSGILGVSVGIIGMLQANEVLKIVLEIGETLSGKLLVYNMLNNNQQIFEFSKKEPFIMNESSLKKRHITTVISASEITASLALKRINDPDSLFIDVRNTDEYPKIVIDNSLKVPLNNLLDLIDVLDKNKKLFVFCQTGIRSKKAVTLLKEHQFNNVKSIVGGAKYMDKILNETFQFIN
jgi:sulfur-carrier protein adenylyltransferase/sulfurtransferase